MEVEGPDLWSLITATPLPSRVVDFPRLDPKTGEPLGQVRLVPLTQNEQMQAQARAGVRVIALLKKSAKESAIAQSILDATEAGKDLTSPQSLAHQALYKQALTTELLFRIARDPNDPAMRRTVFKSPDIVGELSPDEVGVLMSKYLAMMVEISPIYGEFDSDEGLEAWLDKAVKSAEGASFLASASPLALIQSVSFLLRRSRSSSNASSSPGTQPRPTESGSESSEPTASTATSAPG